MAIVRRPDQRLVGTSISGAGPAPAGNVFRFIIITGPGNELLVYDGTPVAGNLLYSIASVNSTDTNGNAILGGGAASYEPVASGTSFATLTSAGGIGFFTGPANGTGPWAFVAQLAQFAPGALELTGSAAFTELNIGNTNGFIKYIFPSGDTTGLTDWQNLTTAMTSFGAVIYLVPGLYYILYPLVIAPWCMILGVSNIVDNSALSDFGVTIVVVAGFTNAHSPVNPAPWPESSAILMVDETTGGYTALSSGQQLLGINVDLTNAPAGTHGITTYNAVYGVSLGQVTVLEAPGTGLFVAFASSQADGLHVYHTSLLRCGRSVDVNVADAVFDDVNATGATTDHNWFIRNAVDSIFSNCRGGNAPVHNWYFAVNQTITGGYCLLEGCGSDLADSYGMLIDYGNTGGIWLDIVGFSSDGDNAGAGTGAIRISAAPQPVMFDALTVNTTAAYGVQYANAASLNIASAIIEAATAPFNNGGGNGTVMLNTDAILDTVSDNWNYIGAAGQPAFGAGWANTGGGNATLAYKQRGTNILIKGYVTNSVAGNTANIFVLPVGYRPNSQQIFTMVENGTVYGNSLVVQTNGDVTPFAAAGGGNYAIEAEVSLSI
jgi:hypothetical protein